MKLKSEFSSDNDEGTITADLNEMIERFTLFNKWLIKCTSITQYPLSKELYGISSKSYKFQTSMALIVPALYKKIYYEMKIDDTIDFQKVINAIRESLSNSFLEKAAYSVSSTNSKEIKKLIDDFELSEGNECL